MGRNIDYGWLLTRAWEIIWQHKFLILLGVFAALAGGGRLPSFNFSTSGGDLSDFGFDFRGPRTARDLGIPLEVLIALGVVLGLLALAIGLALWVVALTARGGLIAGVDAIENGVPLDFGQAWLAGWQRIWRLLGISLVQASPVLLLIIPMMLGMLLLMNQEPDAIWRGIPEVAVVAALVLLVCGLIPVLAVMALLGTLAERACMLEDRGVLDSYRRAIDVLRHNLASVVLLALIQLAISMGLGMVLLLPTFFMALCCLLWPVLLLINGAITAYTSSLWTLGWREWTMA